jgi:hypothetical protein
MKDIIVAAPIFSPNDIGFKIQMNSIKSFFKYLDAYNITNLRIIYSGWCKHQEYWKEIESFILNPNQKQDVLVEDKLKNYGKAVVVNDIIKNDGENYKYIFTFDSDILFDPNEPNVLQRCRDIAEVTENFGLISLNQQENNCHLYDHFTESRITNGEVLKWHPGGAGIAGGCLFISMAAFRSIGGYRKLGVYDSDDGFMMLDMAAKKYFLAACETINIMHPYTKELKEGYNQWKADILHNRRIVGEADYSKKFNDAEKFWR